MLKKIKEFFSYVSVGECFMMASLIPLAVAAAYLFIQVALWIFGITLPLIIFWKLFLFAFLIFILGNVIDFITALVIEAKSRRESNEEVLEALMKEMKQQ